MKRFTRKMILGALSVILPVSALAAYPEKPVNLVHGFGAGGNADAVARVVATALESELGKTVIVEARTGAGGTIASTHVARSPADGYTLIMLTGGHTASAAVRKELPYDPINDFTMISTVTHFPFVVAVNAQHPAKNLAQLLEIASKEAGSITYSSVGVGSTQHLTGELMTSMGNVELLHIPYRGGGAPVVSVLAGDVDVLVDTVTVAGSHIQSGDLRALATTAKEPWPLLPDAPTVNETIPDFEVMSWLGIAGPANMPDDIVTTINTALQNILNNDDIRAQLNAMGSEALPSTPQGMHDMVVNNLAQWKKVVVDAQIPLQ